VQLDPDAVPAHVFEVLRVDVDALDPDPV
jgi:hypothetical protein